VSREPTVRAAGGIVRRRRHGTWEILLVHRPRYDDWSLPKGKADDGERDEDTALREVEEETGLRCELGTPVGETRYRDGKGRRKVVRYWMMDPVSATHAFVPNAEVDEVVWCSTADAAARCTYQHDRDLLHGIGELT